MTEKKEKPVSSPDGSKTSYQEYPKSAPSPDGSAPSYYDPPSFTRGPSATGEGGLKEIPVVQQLIPKLKEITPQQLITPHPRPPEIRELNIIPNTFLIIVDVYNWAWDIASRELLKAMPQNTGTIVCFTDLEKVNPHNYNVVLIYPWAVAGLMERLDPRNTVVCVAGGEQLDLLPFLELRCGRFKYFGACNGKIQARLKKEFPDKTVLHLTHGVNHILFKPPKTQPKEFTIGWVGNASRGIKRHFLAVGIAAQGGFKLDVAGFKKYSHSEMPRYYQSIHALIVTSTHEAHPLVVYEAMSTGLPVVTTNVGDVSQYIDNGENGFILPRNAKPADYIKILNMLKSDEKLRRRVGEAARQTVIKELSWSSIVQQYTPLTKLMGAKVI